MTYLKPTIRLQDDGRVHLTYKALPNFAMGLDFSRWLKAFPKGPVCFVHWQRAPKYQRRFGVYWRDAEGNQGYEALTRVDVFTPSLGRQFNEAEVSTSPVAVAICQNARLEVDGMAGKVLAVEPS